jgi:hypothetical protein
MTLDYNRVWETMNELESVTAKICSAREILACAIDAHESGNANRTETLLYAVDEYLQYYLSEFDKKFQEAWSETVTKLHQEEHSVYSTCDKDDTSPEYKDAWNSFWEDEQLTKVDGYSVNGQSHSDYWYDYDRNDSNRPNPFEDKVVKWQLPVEQVHEEYYITFPDDLLEAANLKAGDDVEWIDKGDGSFILQKVTKTEQN